MDTGGLMIIFGMIGYLDHAFCSPYIFCTRSQRVAALTNPKYSETSKLVYKRSALYL